MITKEEMIQLADAQLRYEAALMEARKQYEQEVIQAIAWVRQGLPVAVPGSPALPGQMFPPPAPAPGQPAGAQAVASGGKQ